jgi:hypothetical protein
VTQLLFEHTTPLAVHCPLPPPPVQHACPEPPHVPQLPFAHVPPMPGQLELAVTHRWFTQQPPPQSFASQQAWPAPPHCAQTPAPPPPAPPWQTYPLVHERPAQHAAAAPPHAAQTFPLQTPPVPQVLPVQQGWPGAPHAPPPELLAEASPPDVPELLDPPQQMTAASATIAIPALQANRFIVCSFAHIYAPQAPAQLDSNGRTARGLPSSSRYFDRRFAARSHQGDKPSDRRRVNAKRLRAYTRAHLAMGASFP